MFTPEEIQAAKATRDAIRKEGPDELKAVYMAGEIVMWDGLKGKYSLEIIKLYLQSRITELNKADAEFCNDRWNMDKPELERNLYREESNKVCPTGIRTNTTIYNSQFLIIHYPLFPRPMTKLSNIISPEKFRWLASFIDAIDASADIKVKESTEVQDDLRKFADALEEKEKEDLDTEVKMQLALTSLDKIAYPIKHFQAEAEKEGKILDGHAAIQLSNDANFIKGMAKSALEVINNKIT